MPTSVAISVAMMAKPLLFVLIGASAALIGFVALSGDSSLAANLVAALASIAQAWMAVAMWRLARQQFAFSKDFALITVRSENYHTRLDVFTRWKAATRRIGMTNIDRENIVTMRALIAEIRRVFDDDTAVKARAACTAASKARDRKLHVEIKEGGIAQDDEEYRRLIEQFKAETRAIALAMDAHLRIGGV